MKAITVRQPYAAAIAHWGKTVENRGPTWRYKHTGPIAIHAGARKLDMDEALADPRILTAVLEHDASTYDMPLGAIVAVATLGVVHDATDGCCGPWGDLTYNGQRARHLPLSDVRVLGEPVRNVVGALGVWELNPFDEAAVLGQIEAVDRA